MYLIKNFTHSLSRYRISFLLNVIVLSVAFATAFIAFVQVNYDLGFNKGIKDSERIFRLENKQFGDQYGIYISAPLARLICENDPSIEWYGSSSFSIERTVTANENNPEQSFKIPSLRLTDGMLHILGIEPLSGELGDWKEKNRVAISEEAAEEYHLKIGDQLFLSNNKGKTYTIGFVYSDFPVNSDLAGAKMLYSPDSDYLEGENWSNWNAPLYVKLRSEEMKEDFVKLARETLIQKSDGFKNLDENYFRCTSLRESYFTDDLSFSDTKVGNLSLSLALLGAGIVVLLIAFINFFNFFLALIPQRIRSVNTRKVFGASTSSLRLGFLLESCGLIALSLLLAALWVWLAGGSPLKEIVTAPFGLQENPLVVCYAMLLGFILGIATALYPAFYITSFSPAFLVKGNFSHSQNGRLFRYILIGFQFVCSSALIIAALFVHIQRNYLLTNDMGFNRNNLLTCYVGEIGDTPESRESFRQRLKESPLIEDATFSQFTMIATQGMSWGRTLHEEGINFDCRPVNYNFLKVMGIPLTEGRDFTEADELSDNGIFIFNETARKKYNIALSDQIEGHNGNTHIGGFCSDFNIRPTQYAISPVTLYIYGKEPWSGLQCCYIRYAKGASLSEAINYIQGTLDKLNHPNTEVKVVNEWLKEFYESEKRQSFLVTLFSFISIIISLMGIFGLVLFETEHRSAEIAIRRVHGASINGILRLFAQRFVLICFIGFALSLPLAVWGLRGWLENFAVQTPLHLWVFAVAFGLVVTLTLVVVICGTWKTVSQNPMKVLKRE